MVPFMRAYLNTVHGTALNTGKVDAAAVLVELEGS